MERIPMTPPGFEKLRVELRQLKTVDRAQNIKDIEEARAHGDLSENAEYAAAKEKQSHIAARITELENKIGKAEVIDPKTTMAREKIVFGATVALIDLETEEKVSYQIVGDEESEVKSRKIGISSPLARGLIGKFVDEEIKIHTPKGEKEFQILKIEYV